MRALSSTDLFCIWETTHGRGHIEKGLAMLRAACPELDAEARFDLSIGARDARLINLHERTFGHRFACIATCPACAERLELAFTVNDVRAELPPRESPESVCPLRWGDYEVTFRVPTSRDLWRIRFEPTVSDARRALFLRCISEVRRGSAACDPGALPEDLMAAIAEAMRSADPWADVALALSCPACAHAWTDGFDIVSYVWAEIQSCVSHLVHDVHELASRYGWSEESILALTPARRQLYLQWGQA